MILILEAAPEAPAVSLAALAKEALPEKRIVATRDLHKACAALNREPRDFELLMVDLELMREVGVDLIRHCRKVCPWIRCVALGSLAEDEELICAALAGAHACLYKEDPKEALVKSLRCCLISSSAV